MIRVLLLIVLAFGSLPASAQTPQPGGWIADSTTGCKIWNPKPAPNEAITWNGACADGFAQGQGVVQWFTDGQANDRFEGEYLDGRRNGHGVFIWASGNRYDGSFKDDHRTGRGVLTWAKKGERYEGEWRDNKPNGRGTMTTADGKAYVGIWKNGCYEREKFRLLLFSLNEELCIGN